MEKKYLQESEIIKAGNGILLDIILNQTENQNERLVVPQNIEWIEICEDGEERSYPWVYILMVPSKMRTMEFKNHLFPNLERILFYDENGNVDTKNHKFWFVEKERMLLEKDTKHFKLLNTWTKETDELFLPECITSVSRYAFEDTKFRELRYNNWKLLKERRVDELFKNSEYLRSHTINGIFVGDEGIVQLYEMTEKILRFDQPIKKYADYLWPHLKNMTCDTLVLTRDWRKIVGFVKTSHVVLEGEFSEPEVEEVVKMLNNPECAVEIEDERFFRKTVSYGSFWMTKDEKVLVRYEGSRNVEVLEVPKTVECICMNAFVCLKHIGTLIMPPAYQPKQETLIFKDCEIDNFTLPQQVTSWERKLWKYCVRIKNLKIPGNIRWIGENSFQNTIITNLTLEEGIVGIGDSAFDHVDAIKLPKTVMYLGRGSMGDACDITIRSSIVQNFIRSFLDAPLDEGKFRHIHMYNETFIFPDKDELLWDTKTKLVESAEQETEMFRNVYTSLLSGRNIKEKKKRIELAWEIFSHDAVAKQEAREALKKMDAYTHLLFDAKRDLEKAVEFIQSDIMTKGQLAKAYSEAVEKKDTVLAAYLAEKMNEKENKKTAKLTL